MQVPSNSIHDRYRPWNLETGIKAPCSRFESESSWIFYQRTRLSRLFPPFSTPFFSMSGDSTSQVLVSHCISLCYESNFINSPKKLSVSRADREWLVGFGVFDVLDSVIFGPRCAMSLYVTCHSSMKSSKRKSDHKRSAVSERICSRVNCRLYLDRLWLRQLAFECP